MRRVCFVVHDLNPAAGPGWELAALAAHDGIGALVLHAADAGPEFQAALAAHAQSLGAEYQNLASVAPPPDLPVFPAVDAHRTGVRVAQALATLQPAAAWFVGDPTVAAAAMDARSTGLIPPHCRMVLVPAAFPEARRDAEARFPSAGRDDLAAEYLGRHAAEAADAVVALSAEAAAWLRQSGWALPELVAGFPDEETRRKLFQPAAREATSPRPRVSVCLPFYEQPAFLLQALEMLAAQTLPPDEVIVIDDGSKSAEAAGAWAEARRRFARPGWVFLRDDNHGPSAARNRAAREATGDALVFCDADNRFRPGMIAAFAEALSSSGADCVTCGFQAFRDPPGEGELGRGYQFFPVGPSLELGLVENDLGDTNFCVRRSAFLALRGFPADNTTASEDWEFLLRLVLAGRSLVVRPEILFDYRIASGSHARRHSELRSARLAVRPLLESAPPLWRRLWPHLAGLVREPRAEKLAAEVAPVRAQAERLSAENVILAGAAKAAREDQQRLRAEADRLQAAQEALHGEIGRLSAGLAAHRQAARARRAEIVLLEHGLKRRQEEVAAALGQTEEIRHRLAQLTEGANRDRARLEAALARAEDKIARMQASFSWRLTAPLRALRRRLIDSRRKPGPPPPILAAASSPKLLDIAFHIDAPRVWRPQDAEITIRGWCFARDAERLEAIRARVGVREYPGTYGLGRPDLTVAFKEWPQSGEAGFKVDVLILGHDASVVLEARDHAGHWHRFFERSLGPSPGEPPPGSYEHWVQACDRLSEAALRSVQAAAAALPERKISVLMPVFNPAPAWLERAIGSVRGQLYPHWELCIADDASTDPKVGAILDRAAAADPRIRLVRREKNGHISAATNTALAAATGEFAALFDHDDELAPHALYCVAAELARHPDTDLVYTDEDKIDEQGFRFDPHFKPDWNPDLLRSQNYLSHLAVYRTALLRELGGLREGFEGSQDWDLALRAAERVPPERIRHVPRILYHWRAGEGSTALHLGEKRYIGESARRALEEHFARTGREAALTRIVGGHWRVSYALPKERPLVSILIPTRNAAELTRLCLASIIARTRYAPYEIVLVDNGSDDPAALALFEEAEREDEVRVLRYMAPFNYSAINNFAVRQARGEVVCLLNNDMEVIEPAWLDELVGHALRPEIGAVGARLYYPDFRVQHAGVVTGLGGVAGHPFKLFDRAEAGTPQFRPHLTQNLSAVTAACLVIRRSVYFEAGGFDEYELPVAFNDVDFCLKVEKLGYRNLYVPAAELIHHESASRGAEDTPEKVRRFQAEIEAIKRRWGQRLLNDPAYNPNLSLDSEDFALAYPPRLPPLADGV